MMPNRVSLGLLLIRLPMGVYFLLAGIPKVRGGIGNFVQAVSGHVPSYVPPAVGQAYLYAVPVLEILVGLLLVIGLFTRVTALVASLMIVSYILGVTGLSAAAGPFHANVVFLGITLGLLCAGAGGLSVDGLRSRKPRGGKK